VIVTSYLFPSATFSLDRLRSLAALVGKDRLGVDVSCRKRDGGWWVAMDKWTRITDLEVTKGSFEAILSSVIALLSLSLGWTDPLVAIPLFSDARYAVGVLQRAPGPRSRRRGPLPGHR
jgi:hypothetical protein